jgi:hypothetical protein
MQIERTLAVGSGEIFALFEETLRADLGERTIKSGLQYHKHLKKDDNPQHDKIMHVFILEYDKPNLYKVKFCAEEGDYLICYQLHDLSEGQCQVVYEENFEAKKKQSWLLKLLLPKARDRNTKKRLEAVLANLEKTILERRSI